jgi:hypothetical protein
VSADIAPGCARAEVIFAEAVLTVLAAVLLGDCPARFGRLLPKPLAVLCSVFEKGEAEGIKAVVRAGQTSVFAAALQGFDGRKPERVTECARLLSLLHQQVILEDHAARMKKLRESAAAATARELERVGVL